MFGLRMNIQNILKFVVWKIGENFGWSEQKILKCRKIQTTMNKKEKLLCRDNTRLCSEKLKSHYNQMSSQR